MRVVRRLGLQLLFGSLALSLSSCLSRGDSLAPIVTIYDPPCGAVRPVDDLRVTGYVMDDSGVSSVRANNSELLDAALFKEERGKRLVQFWFKPLPQGDQFAATIVAEDMSGRRTTVNCTLQIDVTPPTVTVEQTALGGGQVRVSGTAQDNDLVTKITVAGRALRFVAAQEKRFTVDVEVSEGATLDVEDRAGNRISEPLTP